MKTKHRLATFLRVIFGVTYLVGGIVTAIVILMLLLGSLVAAARDGQGRLGIPIWSDVFLSASDPAGIATVRTGAGSAQDVKITRLAARVSVNVFSRDRELAAFARWTALLPTIVLLAGATAVSRLLRTLCARIEMGEVLSEENLRLVRNIGALYVAIGIVEFVANACSQYFLVGYLARHTTLSGIGATFDASVGSRPELLFGWVDGLLIILLAEAFRQGLALKREAELTV